MSRDSNGGERVDGASRLWESRAAKSDAKSLQKPMIEVVAVGWDSSHATAFDTSQRHHDGAAASIRWIDVVCKVCHLEFRAVRARSVGQPGFYPMVFNLTIGCECGAVAGIQIDELLK